MKISIVKILSKYFKIVVFGNSLILLMDDIETNIILDGEVLQGSIYKNDLDYIHEIDSSIIDKIIDIKCSVEVKCKLAGIIQ